MAQRDVEAMHLAVGDNDDARQAKAETAMIAMGQAAVAARKAEEANEQVQQEAWKETCRRKVEAELQQQRELQAAVAEVDAVVAEVRFFESISWKWLDKTFELKRLGQWWHSVMVAWLMSEHGCARWVAWEAAWKIMDAHIWTNRMGAILANVSDDGHGESLLDPGDVHAWCRSLESMPGQPIDWASILSSAHHNKRKRKMHSPFNQDQEEP